MKILPVSEVRKYFSALLKEVERGEEIGIVCGKNKETIAVIAPIGKYRKRETRKLGILEGKGTVSFSDDWAITEKNS